MRLTTVVWALVLSLGAVSTAEAQDPKAGLSMTCKLNDSWCSATEDSVIKSRTAAREAARLQDSLKTAAKPPAANPAAASKAAPQPSAQPKASPPATQQSKAQSVAPQRSTSPSAAAPVSSNASNAPMVPVVVADTFGHAFTRGPVSIRQYVAALRSNNRQVLNADASEILKGFQTRLPGRFGSIEDLTQYMLGSLTMVQCSKDANPRQQVRMWRVKSGAVDGNWQRPFRPGEMCAYDNNTGEIIFSLSCGNIVGNPHLNVAAAMPTPQPQPILAPPPVNIYTQQPLPPQQVFVQPKKSHWLRNTLVAGAVAGGACVAYGYWKHNGPYCFKVTQRVTVRQGAGAGTP